MVIGWVMLASVLLSFVVMVIGVAGLPKTQDAEPKVTPQPPTPPSFELGVLAPMLVGIVVGGGVSRAVPCPVSQSIAGSWIILLAASSAVTVAGAVLFWRRRSHGVRFWGVGSALVALSMIVLFAAIAGSERCAPSKPAQQTAITQKDARPSAARQAGRGMAGWFVMGFVLGHATVDTVTRGIGLPLLQPARRDLRALAQAGQAEINVAGVFVTAAWPFLLGLFMIGFALWAERARWRRVIGIPIIGATSVLVFPICLGMSAIAVSVLLMPDAALGFWIGGAVLGLIVSLVATIGVARVRPPASVVVVA